jgi:hypothetical protein
MVHRSALFYCSVLIVFDDSHKPHRRLVFFLLSVQPFKIYFGSLKFRITVPLTRRAAPPYSESLLPNAMITQLLGALAPRKDINLNTSQDRDHSSLGRPVARFGQRRFCWEAKGSHRKKFDQEISLKIIKILDSHFDSIPGTDQFTLSLYMVGKSTFTARPTIMLISRNEQSRKGVKKAIIQSGMLSQYPDFGTEYVNKDPGCSNIVPLTSGPPASSDCATLAMDDMKTILYDASIPIVSMGVPIYISNSSSLRPATANLVRVGDQIFFQTVHHAFRAFPVGLDMASVTLEEDLVIDSDSETEDDHDYEAQIEVTTSVGSRSPDTLSCLESQYSGHSRQPSNTQRHSTLMSSAKGRVSLQDRVTGKAALDDTTGQLSMATNDVIANLVDFAPTDRMFEAREPVLPSPETLSVLGRRVEESIEYDLALIEITDQKLKDTLETLLKNGRMATLAYNRIASKPEDDARVYTYTASGGKICGVLSANPSYTRLSAGASFQKVYVVRLDGPLAKGDCGSAIIDANTGSTYGHLVAGCKTTGTAYILAAGQVAEGVGEALPKEMTEQQRLMNATCDSPSPSLLPELEGTRTHQSKVHDTHVDTDVRMIADPQSESSMHDRKSVRNMRSEYNMRVGPGIIQQASRRIRKLSKAPRKEQRTKLWRPIFSTKRTFEDDPFFEARESIAGFEREGGPLDAFLEDADSSIPSWQQTVIREFLQNRQPQNGSVRDLARARLDDREHNTGGARTNPEWLTASSLRDFLSLPVLLAVSLCYKANFNSALVYRMCLMRLVD